MPTTRICMWSGPRNVSTALMYSFAQRRDTRVVDEPLYAHYLRVSGAEHPGRDRVLASMPQDGDAVMRDLATAEFGTEVLFLKQMSHHFVELGADRLEPFEHFLLLRDPGEMLPSLAEVLGEVTLRDTGLPDQIALLKALQSIGRSPFCVDSRTLLLAPQAVLAAVCDRLGLGFDEAMLEWPAGPRPEDGVWAQWWYQNVHKSTGFQPWRPSRRPVPAHMTGLLQDCMRLYDTLQQLSISA